MRSILDSLAAKIDFWRDGPPSQLCHGDLNEIRFQYLVRQTHVRTFGFRRRGSQNCGHKRRPDAQGCRTGPVGPAGTCLRIRTSGLLPARRIGSGRSSFATGISKQEKVAVSCLAQRKKYSAHPSVAAVTNGKVRKLFSGAPNQLGECPLEPVKISALTQVRRA